MKTMQNDKQDSRKTNVISSCVKKLFIFSEHKTCLEKIRFFCEHCLKYSLGLVRICENTSLTSEFIRKVTFSKSVLSH